MIGTLINKNLQWPKLTKLLESQCINVFQYCGSHTIHLDATKMFFSVDAEPAEPP